MARVRTRVTELGYPPDHDRFGLEDILHLDFEIEVDLLEDVGP